MDSAAKFTDRLTQATESKLGTPWVEREVFAGYYWMWMGLGSGCRGGKSRLGLGVD